MIGRDYITAKERLSPLSWWKVFIMKRYIHKNFKGGL